MGERRARWGYGYQDKVGTERILNFLRRDLRDGCARRVQKHKRTQDWRAGPFRSSSPRGEPQIRGVSEAMSAIRVLRTRRKNTVQQRDATLPGGDLDPGPGRTWTRTC